jgi:hypothetical protein
VGSQRWSESCSAPQLPSGPILYLSSACISPGLPLSAVGYILSGSRSRRQTIRHAAVCGSDATTSLWLPPACKGTIFLCCPQHSLSICKVYEHLQDWHQLLSDFRSMYERHRIDSMIVDFPPLDPALKDSPEKLQFLSGIRCLRTLSTHQDNLKFDKIQVNIMTLATCIWWFSMGFEDLPSDQRALLECISAYVLLSPYASR